ncbi:hypothetical protein [Longimicrobium sp.]|uniref:hypothetical protein n=1 Tax=Longimicrobium sp. TaxID=2029185 RepID=UPI002E368BA7|nr:hypothetical protein [Longimicrobium sp.]HEX6040664.1 hypothetical protein [Longimicrobium sp.]
MSSTHNLQTFLANAKNTTSREVLVAHRLIYELKLAAARGNIDLRVYHPDVDRDGFDLVLEAEEATKKIQTKVVYQGSGTKAWEIHKPMLRPSPWYSEHLGFEPTVAGTGLDGGVLIIDLAIDGQELSLSYRYFDVDLLLARILGFTTATPPSHESKLREFHRALMQAPYRGKISLPAWMLFSAKDAESLLALMGLPCRLNITWPMHLRTAAALTWKAPGVRGDLELSSRVAREELDLLTLGAAGAVLDNG